MTIALVEAAAILLWVYAALCLLTVANELRRSEARAHLPGLSKLSGSLMPAAILLVIVVLVGVLFGRSGGLVLGALLVPAGLAYAVHVLFLDLSVPPKVSRRLILTGVIGGAVIIFRQIL